MRRVALLVLPLAVFVLLLAARPFLGQPDIDATLIAGRVTFADGTPAARVQVTVSVGGRGFTFITDDRGFYTGDVQPGPATVAAGRAAVQVILERGMTTVANVVIPQTGWEVHVTHPDGTVATGFNLQCHYQHGGVAGTASPDMVVGGRFMFSTIPAEATAAAVVINRQGGRVPYGTLRRWSFADIQARRVLKVVVEPFVPASVAVVGHDGAPLANMPVRVTLAGQRENIQPGLLWNPDPLPTAPFTVTLPSAVQTDAAGRLSLGMLPPGSYSLTVSSSEIAGQPATLVVRDGAVAPATYTLAEQVRTVRQVIFARDGRPAPGAVATATFLRNGRVTTLNAVADADGVVTWTGLPEARIIVNDGITDGVIEPSVTEVVTPLRPVMPERRTITVRFSPPADTPRPIIWRLYARASGEVGAMEGTNPASADSPMVGDDGRGPRYRLAPGDAFTLVAATRESPPRVAAILNGYVPYLPARRMSIEYPVTFAPAVQATIAFTMPSEHGRVGVPGVSRVQVWPQATPVAVAPQPTLVRMWREVGLLAVQEDLDGRYTVCVPSAGAYRVGVDLFDETSVLPESCTVQIAPRIDMGPIDLPAPVVTVPAGTRVGWLPRNAAGFSRSLTAGAWGETVPIFGPKDDLLALWYKPSPRELVIQRPGMPEQRMALKPTVLQPRVPAEAGALSQFRLLPLLPASRDEVGTSQPGPRADSERVGMGLGEALSSGAVGVPAVPSLRADLWSGQYLLAAEPAGKTGLGPCAAPVAIPADGGILAPSLAIPSTGMRMVLLRFPQADYPALVRQGAQQLVCTYDVPGSGTIPASNMMGSFMAAGAEAAIRAPAPGPVRPPLVEHAPIEAVVALHVPARARRMSIAWLGVGVIADVALPDGDAAHERAVLVLPPWRDTGVRGKIRRSDDRPASHAALVAMLPGIAQAEIMLRTDAEGTYTVKGVPEGTLVLREVGDGPGAAFRFVPYDGMAGDWGAGTLRDTSVERRKLEAEAENLRATLAMFEALARELEARGGAPDELAKARAQADAARNRLAELQARTAALEGRVAVPTVVANPAGWTIDVPADGLPEAVLRASDTPTVVTVSGARRDARAWWLGDGAQPVQLPPMQGVGNFAAHGLSRGPGWMWVQTGNGSECWAARMNLGAGTYAVVTDGPSPALGLALPFVAEVGMPGAVTITGQGVREGFRVSVDGVVWQPSPQLGLWVAQVDALPPGTYRINVALAGGTADTEVTVTEVGGLAMLAHPQG